MTNKLLNEAVQAYLEEIGQSKAQNFGVEKKDFDPGKSTVLFERLRRSQEKADKIIGAAVACLVVLFILVVGLVIYLIDKPTTVTVLLGGNIFATLIVVRWLRKLWLEKSAIDTLLIMVVDLPPAQGTKLIMEFYFRTMNQSDSTSPADKASSRPTDSLKEELGK
jgi:hypothetical protein